ncbi:MAG: hypothetical protein ACNYPI_01425 [Arenicellales bacterium WSBS_2016_MAG_OTU3]
MSDIGLSCCGVRGSIRRDGDLNLAGTAAGVMVRWEIQVLWQRAVYGRAIDDRNISYRVKAGHSLVERRRHSERILLFSVVGYSDSVTVGAVPS